MSVSALRDLKAGHVIEAPQGWVAIPIEYIGEKNQAYTHQLRDLWRDSAVEALRKAKRIKSPADFTEALAAEVKPGSFKRAFRIQQKALLGRHKLDRFQMHNLAGRQLVLLSDPLPLPTDDVNIDTYNLRLGLLNKNNEWHHRDVSVLASIGGADDYAYVIDRQPRIVLNSEGQTWRLQHEDSFRPG